jgi:uncharacterized phage protein (TIGR01671 family)
MRDIKFRAWDGIEFYFMDYSKVDIHRCGSFKELNQYTGLRDWDGKEVYEGDILDHTRFPNESCPYSVTFNDGSFRALYVDWDETLPNPIISQDDLDLLNYKVVGNIYENPELIKTDTDQ